jgi:hypothetical protein
MAALPSLGQVDEITEVGVMLDDSIKAVDRKLEGIANTLSSLYSVDESIKKTLESIFEIEEERKKEEDLARGLDLEAEREAGTGENDPVEENKSFKERIGEATSGLGTLALALATAGSLVYAFQDEINNFLGKFGLTVNELDNILLGAAAGAKVAPKVIETPPKPKQYSGRGNNPGAKPPVQTKPKTPPKTQPKATPKAVPKVEVPPAANDPVAKPKPTTSINSKLASGTSKVLSRVAAPAALLLEGANVGMNEMNPNLTREEKNIKHSGSAGTIAGGLAGAKAGAMAGAALGPWGAIAGGLIGGIGGSIVGQDIGEWLGEMGWGDEKKEPLQEPKSSYMTPDLSAEDAAMAGPVIAPTETQMYGMNAQGFVAAKQSREKIAAENMARIEGVKPTISGDNKNVTVKLENSSKETAPTNKPAPIVRQGDVINNVTNISGGKTTGGVSVPSANREKRSPAGQTEIWDAVNGP